MNIDLLPDLLLNPCGMLAIGGVMYVAGNRASAEKEGLRRFGAALAGVTLIAVMAFGIHRRMELLGLAFGAAGFGLFAVGTYWIVLSIFGFVVQAMAPPKARPVVYILPEPEPKPEPPPPPPAPPPPLPPLTGKKLAEIAQEAYDERLRTLESANLDETELAAARAVVKQKYLRALDKAMK